MAARISPARRAAFLRAVAATGNQTLSAERAGLSDAWVWQRKRADPAFRADVEAAVRQARDTLARTGGVGPQGRWRAHAGAELVLRSSPRSRIQIVRSKRQWTPRAEQRFLDALAGCCCLKTACATVGLSCASAYGHAQRWPAFAERWEQALAIGYERLEFAMVAQAGRMLDPDGEAGDDIEPDVPLGPIDFADALQLLKQYRFRVHGVGKPGRRRRPRTLDEVRGSILRKLEAIEGARRWEERCRALGLDPATTPPASCPDTTPARDDAGQQ